MMASSPPAQANDAAEVARSSGDAAGRPLTQDDRKQSRRRGIQWDEPTIAEHDKERGTRKRISEPKTPYRRDELSSAGSVSSVTSDDSSAYAPPDGLKMNDPRITAALEGHWDSGSESESHGKCSRTPLCFGSAC